MTYVIGSACIDILDRACVEVCPVDCIYEGDRKSRTSTRRSASTAEPARWSVRWRRSRWSSWPGRILELDVFLEDSAAFFSATLPGREAPPRKPGRRHPARRNRCRHAARRRLPGPGLSPAAVSPLPHSAKDLMSVKQPIWHSYLTPRDRELAARQPVRERGLGAHPALLLVGSLPQRLRNHA